MTFPLQDDVIYCFDTPIPSVEQENIGVTMPRVFHVAAFTFGDGSSIKPPPGEALSRELQGHYDADGIITRTEPLLVLQPQATKVMYNVNRLGV